MSVETNTPGARPEDTLEIFPIAISHYSDGEWGDLDDAEREIQAVLRILEPFGARLTTWSVPPAGRTKLAVEARLKEWWSGPSHPWSILYWLGHGEGDDQLVALACSDTQRGSREGIQPDDVIRPIQKRHSKLRAHQRDDEPWSIVVLEACDADEFAWRIEKHLNERKTGRPAVLLIATSGGGSTTLGRFSEALAWTLLFSRGSDEAIRLSALKEDMEAQGMRAEGIGIPPYAALRRSVVPVGVTLRDRQTWETVLVNLRPTGPERLDEAAGDLVRAAWHFEGRENETEAILDWCDADSPPLLAVAGSAGSGKSALLGHIFLQSRPALREVLARLECIAPDRETRSLSPEQMSPPVVLRGADVDDAIRRLGTAVGWSPPLDGPLTQLQCSLAEAIGPVRILIADALDEAAQPLAVARLLRELSTAGVRILVGTRRSTQDQMEYPHDGRDLLDALGAGVGDAMELPVAPDEQAMRRFVERRLAEVVSRANARRIAARIPPDASFLFASLLVEEISAQPSLADEEATLDALLDGQPRKLFGVALERFSNDAVFVLEAMARAGGRGIPILGGVLAAVASALARRTIADSAVRDALERADAYVRVDTEHGQTVYRLAHRVFEEHFDGAHAPLGATHAPLEDRHLTIATALIDGVPADRSALNPYVRYHLSGHVAWAGDAGWPHLATHPDVLDRLAPAALRLDALRSWPALGGLPDEILGAVDSSHLMQEATAKDQGGLRQLGMARVAGHVEFADEAADDVNWVLRSAVVRRRPVHENLSAPAPVTALAAAVDGTGSTVLVAGFRDGSVMTWNPRSEEVAWVRPPVHADRPIRAVAGYTVGESLCVASVDSAGAVVIWDVTTGDSHVAAGLSADKPHVLVSVVGASTPRLATAGSDRHVKVWDATTESLWRSVKTEGVRCLEAFATQGDVVVLTSSDDGEIVVQSVADEAEQPRRLGSHRDWVTGIVTFRDRLHGASVSVDGALASWALDGSTAVPSLPEPGHGRVGAVAAAAAHVGDENPEWLVTGHDTGEVAVWNLTEQRRERSFWTGERSVRSLAAWASDGSTLLHVACPSGPGVRVWHVPQDITDDGTRVVLDVAVVEHAGRLAVATADDVGSLDCWDVRSGAWIGGIDRRAGALRAVVTLTDGGRQWLAVGGDDEIVTVRHLEDPAGEPFRVDGHTGPIRCLFADPELGENGILISGSDDGLIILTDVQAGAWRAVRIARDRPVRGVATFERTKGGRRIAAVGHGRTIALVDVDGTRSGTLTGHTNWVMTVCAVRSIDGAPRIATAGDDGTVRLWDPDRPDQPPIWTGTHADRHSVHALIPWTIGDGRVGVWSGGLDGTAQLWDVETGERIQRIPLGAPVNALAAYDRGIVVAMDDGHVVIELGAIT